MNILWKETYRLRKLSVINLLQVILLTIFFIWGIFFKSNANVVSANFLGMLTKVQTTNSLQNFIWCFTNNFAVLFIMFWLSYFTFGVVGTLWCMKSAFSLGYMIKFSFGIRSYLSVCFILLELSAIVIMLLFSTRFRAQRFRLKKVQDDMSDDDYDKEKKYLEKNILLVFAVIFLILLVSATLEMITLSSI